MTPILDGCRCQLCGERFGDVDALIDHDCPDDDGPHGRVVA